MSGAADTLWQCQSETCGALVRAADLRHIVTPGRTFEVCPHCGGAVATAEPPAVSGDVEARERAPSFASALGYPFHGWGLVALGVGTFLVGLLEFGLVFLISLKLPHRRIRHLTLSSSQRIVQDKMRHHLFLGRPNHDLLPSFW